MTAKSKTRIEVRGLTKRFRLERSEVAAVDPVSFTIAEGEFVALLGPSGCGKSTILNMVAGLLPASGGEILIDGTPARPGRVHAQVGYVFQRDTLYPWRTV